MSIDGSFLGYFLDSSGVIKIVILLLIAASLISWTFIFQRAVLYKNTKTQMIKFEEKFWSGADLNKLYTDLTHHHENLEGMQHIFAAGFKEFMRLRKQPGMTPSMMMEGVQRAMRVARSREMEKLERHLSFLATVGSTSPYVGLFGTVWGIMTAFHALGNVQQASIAMVAPGISEALITTAMGLFAAIPAVIAYNRFANNAERLLNQYDTFHDEFSNILSRQVHHSLSVPERENDMNPIMQKNRRRPMAEINVVPYIDVMLVLLIIFMVTTPLLTQGVKINLPQAQAQSIQQDKQTPIIVTVDAAGNYYLNISADPTKPIDAVTLSNRVSAQIKVAQQQNQPPLVLVKGDSQANYGNVVQAMVLLQQAGASDVGLITQPSQDKK